MQKEGRRDGRVHKLVHYRPATIEGSLSRFRALKLVER